MRKYYIVLIIILVQFTNAQRKKLLVEYNEIVQYIPEIINNNKAFLYISDDKTYYETISDNSSKENISIENSIVLPAVEGEYFSEVFTDLKSKTLIENKFEYYILKKIFSVSEPIPTINWTIVNEQKEIDSYTCQKAEATFRGRNYTVWFTDEIPVSSGPWKLNGLPGLILSAEDSSGIFKWFATKITFSDEAFNFTEVKKRMQKYSKITFEDFDKKIIQAYKDKADTIKARNRNRNIGMSFSFSTSQWKEPINEWRTETEFN